MRSEYELAIIELEELIVSVEEGVGSVRLADAARLAIEALRKQEPCDMCNPDENGAGIIVDNMWKWNSETKKRYPMLAGGLANYCPNCGRKLEEEL